VGGVWVSVHNFPYFSFSKSLKILMCHLHTPFLSDLESLNYGTILNAYMSRERLLPSSKSINRCFEEVEIYELSEGLEGKRSLRGWGIFQTILA